MKTILVALLCLSVFSVALVPSAHAELPTEAAKYCTPAAGGGYSCSKVEANCFVSWDDRDGDRNHGADEHTYYYLCL